MVVDKWHILERGTVTMSYFGRVLSLRQDQYVIYRVAIDFVYWVIL